MKKFDARALQSSKLVDKFIEELAKLEIAASTDNIPIYNKHLHNVLNIIDELRVRPGDHRHLLVPLLIHKSCAVRYFSAFATLTVAPQKSVETLDNISSYFQYPFSGKAIGILYSLRNGTFVPS